MSMCLEYFRRTGLIDIATHTLSLSPSAFSVGSISCHPFWYSFLRLELLCPNLSGPHSLSLLLARSHSLSYLALALAHSRTLSLYKSMFVRGLLFEVFTHTHTHTHTHTNSLNQIHIRTNPPSLLLQACTLTLRLVRPFPCICGVLHDKASPSGNEVIPPTVRV